MDVANRLASEAGCKELSIEVFEQNEGALRLYKRHGYRIVARRPVVPHPCYPSALGRTRCRGDRPW